MRNYGSQLQYDFLTKTFEIMAETDREYLFLKEQILPHYIEVMNTIATNDPQQLTKENITKYLDDIRQAVNLMLIDDPDTRELTQENHDILTELMSNLKW